MPKNSIPPDLEMNDRLNDLFHAVVNDPDLCAAQTLKVFRRFAVGD